MLWQGRPDIAEREFRAALERDAAVEDGEHSLELAARELRPALGLRFTRTADNQNFTRDETWLTWRRWSADRAWRLELAYGLEAWFVDAPRPTPYRMHQLSAFLQLLW